ncbi:GMC oxidoreductase [Acidocella aminolytica]|nr:GMC family oxidoreductase [Acidocella aminolytica]
MTMQPLSSIFETPVDALVEIAPQCLVIGSGTSGVTAAIELAQRGLRVAVIEAGPFVLSEHIGSTPFADQHEMVPRIHDLVRRRTVWTDSAHEADAKAGQLAPNNNAWEAVGGRTLFWGGCTPRFIDSDFHDWPYDADHFRPWYERAEQLISASGYNDGTGEVPHFIAETGPLVSRLAEAGITATCPPLGIDTRAVRDGRMSRGFDSSVSRLLRCPAFGRRADGAKLTLTAECAAVDLLLDGATVRGVRVLDRRSGRHLDLHADEVILAGGAVQSTRLALAAGLDRIDPLVGRYVGDHLFVQAALKLPAPLHHKAVYLFIPPLPDRPYHVQMQGMFSNKWYNPLDATMWLDGEAHGDTLLYYCFGASRATDEARVVLTGQPGDPLRGYAVINDRTPEDLATLEAMEDFVQHVGGALGAQVARVERHHAGAALHEFGGLRMGTDPSSSVTDPDGRFRRVANLVCVDSAIWPSQGSANSYLTITATALRNAEKLAARLSATTPELASQGA